MDDLSQLHIGNRNTVAKVMLQIRIINQPILGSKVTDRKKPISEYDSVLLEWTKKEKFIQKQHLLNSQCGTCCLFPKTLVLPALCMQLFLKMCCS